MKTLQIVFAIFLWMDCSVRNSSASEYINRETTNPSDLTTKIPTEESNGTENDSFSKDTFKVTRNGFTAEKINGTENEYFARDISSGVTTNSTIMTTEELEYSEEFLSCKHVPIENTSYVEYPNGSVYVSLYDTVFDRMNYVRYKDGIAVCSDILNSKESKYPLFLAIVTNAGMAISSIFLILHIITFLIFPRLRNVPGYSLCFLCLSLLVAYTCAFLDLVRNTNCEIAGTIKAYCFLASFFWMNTMSYDIWRSLRMATSKLRLTGNSDVATRVAMYSAYAWGVPFVFIAIGLIVNETEAQGEYMLVMNVDECWFKHKQALLVYFALPMFVLLGLNVLLFVSSFYMIHSASMKTAENRADLWTRFLMSLRLAVVMGLIWIFGVLGGLTQQEWLACLNVFFTVLHGMFIFFSFSLTGKVRKEIRRTIQRRKISAFPTQSYLPQ